MPKYIGLRVNSYRPETTSAVVGLMGIMLVRALRNKPMLHTVKTAHTATTAGAPRGWGFAEAPELETLSQVGNQEQDLQRRSAAAEFARLHDRDCCDLMY